MNETKAKVVIGIPTMGSIHPALVSRLLLWSKKYDRKMLDFYFTMRVAPTDRARNDIVNFFLNRKDATHLFFIDSDTIPPEDALEKLLAHETPFVTALTPIMSQNKQTGRYEFYDNAFFEPTKEDDGTVKQTSIVQRDTGVHPIYRCGGSCMLIKREVFETLKPPYFKFESDEKGLKHTRSEDIYFCDMMREAGIEIMADSSVHCNHQKDIML